VGNHWRLGHVDSSLHFPIFLRSGAVLLEARLWHVLHVGPPGPYTARLPAVTQPPHSHPVCVISPQLSLQLCEISTPFLHFRWFLSMSGLRHSTLYVVNALTLSALFLAVRGGLMTVMLYRIFSTVDNPVYWPGCPACTVAMNCAWAFQALQYMWCVKVVTGVTAVLFGKGKKDAIEAEGERVHKEKLQSPIAASPKPATDKKEQ
jgi:TLC domain